MTAFITLASKARKSSVFSGYRHATLLSGLRFLKELPSTCISSPFSQKVGDKGSRTCFCIRQWKLRSRKAFAFSVSIA